MKDKKQKMKVDEELANKMSFFFCLSNTNDESND